MLIIATSSLLLLNSLLLEDKELTKAFIGFYSEMNGLDRITMINIARAESSFNPKAKNPNSSATGLFQIIKGTWKYFDCKGQRDNAIDNIECAMKIAKDGLHHWDESSHVWNKETPISSP